MRKLSQRQLSAAKRINSQDNPRRAKLLTELKRYAANLDFSCKLREGEYPSALDTKLAEMELKGQFYETGYDVVVASIASLEQGVETQNHVYFLLNLIFIDNPDYKIKQLAAELICDAFDLNKESYDLLVKRGVFDYHMLKRSAKDISQILAAENEDLARVWISLRETGGNVLVLAGGIGELGEILCQEFDPENKGHIVPTIVDVDPKYLLFAELRGFDSIVGDLTQCLPEEVGTADFIFLTGSIRAVAALEAQIVEMKKPDATFVHYRKRQLSVVN